MSGTRVAWAALLAAAAAGCATPSTMPYLRRTAAVVEGIEGLAASLGESARSLAEVEALWLASRNLDLRRRDPGEAERLRAEAAAAADAALARLEAVRDRALDLAARARAVGRAGVPEVRVVHAPTARTFSYRDHQAKLEALFSALAGVETAAEVQADPFEEYRGEGSRAAVAASGRPVLIAKELDLEPVDLDALEREGVLRSPFQVANFLDALRAYLRAYKLRIEGREAVDFYQVTPFRNVNKPWWPGASYEPILHWEVRITRNFALASEGMERRSTYLGVLGGRLGPIGRRVVEIAEEVALYRRAFERAAARPD